MKKVIHIVLFIGFLMTCNQLIIGQPTISSLSLFATSAENLTNDNLICTYDEGPSVVETASVWYSNGLPVNTLFLPFEGGPTNALLDFSGNNNNASVVGNPTWSGTGGHNGNGAFDFDVTDGTDYLYVADGFPLNSSYTKTAWIRVTGYGLGFRNIMSSVSNGDNDHCFMVNQVGRLIAGHSDGTAIVSDPNALLQDQWYFVAVTFDYGDGEMVLYKNGIKVNSAIVSEALRDVADATVEVGAKADNFGFQGTIDDPRIYRRALSPQQISSLFSNGSNVLMAPETKGSDQWHVDVTPFSDTEVGSTYSSNTITIAGAEIDDLILQATSANNLVNDSLFSSYSVSSSVVETALAWYRNGSPDALLYMPFEGGSKNALLDLSGNDNHASYSVNPVHKPTWDPAGGYNGKGGFIFDGDDYLLAGDVFPVQSSYTITAWIRIAGSGYRNIISSIEEVANNHTFKVNPDGTLNAGHSSGSYIVRDPAPLNPGQWYYVALTFDYVSGDMKIYKDGVAVAAGTASVDLRDVAYPSVLIGALSYVNCWNGNIDQPRIYDYALSAEQIHAQYVSGDNLIVPEETESLEDWRVDVTPFATYEVGSTVSSNTITLHSILVSEIQPQTIPEGAAFDVIDLDGFVEDLEYADNELVWTAEGNTDLVVSIDPGTHIATIAAPDEDWFGSENISFIATNPKTDSDTANAIFTVQSVNDAPVLVQIGDQSVDEDQVLSQSVNFTDVDQADSHIIEVVSDNSNVVIGNLSGNTSGSTYDMVPAPEWNGTAQITVRVTDNGVGPLYDEETFTLTVDAVNDAPVLELIGDQSVDEDQALQQSVNFADADQSDSHIIEVVSDNSNVVIGNLSGNTSGSTYDMVPAPEWNGTAQITVRVTDNGVGPLYDEETFTLTVDAVNDAPVLELIGDRSVDEDQALQQSVNFADADLTDTHTIEVVSDNSNVVIGNLSGNTSGSTYDMVPAPDWNGTAQITVRVTDNGVGALYDEETFTLTVDAVNDAPVLELIGDQSVDEDQALQQSVNFADVDLTDTHTIEVVSDNSNVVIDNLSGNTSGSTYDMVPAPEWNGTAQITVRVTDNGEGTLYDEETFTLTVVSVNDAPVLELIGDRSVDEDQALQQSVNFADADLTDTHTIEVVSDNSNVVIENLSGNTSGSTYDMVPAPEWNGTAQITVRVTDNGEGALYDEETFILTVVSVNDPPNDILLSNNIIDERVEPGTVVGVFSTIDPDPEDEHQYTFYSGVGIDNNLFIIDKDTLKTNAEIDYEVKSNLSILVQVSDGNGGKFLKGFDIIVNDIDETDVRSYINNLSFTVYPVPARDQMTVEIDNPDNIELTMDIISSEGRRIYSERTFHGKTIDVSAFTSGNYILVIRGTDWYKTRKLIIQNR